MNRHLIKPKRLSAGSVVGLVAPASNVEENDRIYYATEILQSIGFRVKLGGHIYKRNGYCAGSSAERAEDINKMFADKEVEGIFALRGGFGSIHVAPLLDYKLIQANPKVLIGYSDITILLNAIHVKTGLVTFHGPTATSPFSDYTLAELRKVLCEAHTAIPLAAPPKNELKPGVVERRNRIKKISEGRARGRLVGGNLYCLLRMLGTPYAPDFNSSILFLEECGEKPYKIDGMLTQLRLAGVLQCVAAVVLGKFLAKPMLPDSELALEQLFADTFGDLQIPVIRGLMIGHISDQATIPIGVEASIDSDASQLILHENAVT